MGSWNWKLGPNRILNFLFFFCFLINSPELVVGGGERERALIETTIKEFLLSVLVCALSISYFRLGVF